MKVDLGRQARARMFALVALAMALAGLTILGLSLTGAMDGGNILGIVLPAMSVVWLALAHQQRHGEKEEDDATS